MHAYRFDLPASSHSFHAPACKHQCLIDDAKRITRRKHDPLTGKTIRQRARVIARVYGKTGKKTWSRAALPAEEALLRRVEAEPLPDTVPNVEIPWGDLYRRGYHLGITHVHHFYTRRNLIAFARLWERTGAYEERLRDALRFWLLSYNASHATIMTRVVAKRGQKDLVLTGAPARRSLRQRSSGGKEPLRRAAPKTRNDHGRLFRNLRVQGESRSPPKVELRRCAAR